jgi:dimethylhistidine N-methyltransferase
MNITNLVAPGLQGEDAQKEQFAIDVLMGLCATPKSLASKYFYDDAGSEIFRKITQHHDYYPTRTEIEIIREVNTILPQVVNEKEIDIVELGAGDGHKSQLIIQGFLEAGHIVNYYPIDISRKAMDMLGRNIDRHENLNIHGVVAEYFEGLRLVRQKSTNKQLVLFLGSNIGNFDRVQNQGFLRKLWISMNASDYVLLGFDLKKDVGILTSAYNDSGGHTKDFNLNILRRINNELGGEFDINKFQHLGVYSPTLGAMESYIIATEGQDVFISALERSFHFEAYEPIHLEYSFKFLKSDIDFLSKKTGFDTVRHFTDSNEYFIDSLWKVVKESSPT